jgi:hypothetical protein
MDDSMKHKMTCRTKRTSTVQMNQRGKNPGINKKKNPTGGMDVCVVFVVRTVAWNVK